MSRILLLGQSERKCPLTGSANLIRDGRDEGALLPEFGTRIDGSFRGLAS